MNHCRYRYAGASEIRLKHLDQKVRSRAKASCVTNANGQTTPGLKVAPKAFTIMYYAELGKPYMLPENGVSDRKERRRHRGQKRGIKSEGRFCN